MNAIVRAGFALAALAVILELASGPGARLGLWHFRSGFSLLKAGAWLGIAGFVLCQASLTFSIRKGLGLPKLALAGWLLALPAAVIPLGWKRLAGRVPPIHDITTDTVSPPVFEAVLKAREGAPNAVEYGGAAVASLQEAAYPDIQPKLLPLPPEESFARALAAAQALGWEIVAADAKKGVIEAVDTTFWFGFKDDVVVRVRGEKDGSRVDARSLSRVGKSDVGANAKRLRGFLNRL